MKFKKLDFDPLERAESIMADAMANDSMISAERREQIRDLIALSQAKSLRSLSISKRMERI